MSVERTTNIDYNSSELRYSDGADNASAMIFHNRIWRVQDVASFLGCSIGHVYNLSSDERIPKIKKGKFLYFIPDKIFDWILQGELK